MRHHLELTFLWHCDRANNHQVNLHLGIQTHRHTEVFYSLQEHKTVKVFCDSKNKLIEVRQA